MPDINVSFRNDSGASRGWIVADLGRDAINPPVIFNGFLDADQVTDPIGVFASDGLNGQITYAGSGTAQQVVNVGNGDEVKMK
jgi:hypothetical protein